MVRTDLRNYIWKLPTFLSNSKKGFLISGLHSTHGYPSGNVNSVVSNEGMQYGFPSENFSKRKDCEFGAREFW